MKQSGRFFQFLTSLVLVLAVLVPVRVVPAQAEEGEYTFEANVDFCDASTGHVWINGVDTREPAEPFIFDWGDGTVESAWFVADHVYSDTNLTYLVTITSALGGETTVTVEFANCPPLEIQAWIEEIIPETGYVRVNGFVRGSPLVRVEWGDGSEPTESFFPVEHVYADLGRDYVITVTGTYYDGSIGIQALPFTFAQAEAGGLNIRAYVDGNSQLVIQGNTAYWYHNSAAAPGRHMGLNEPTLINGMEWYPTWPDIPDEENRDCNCVSSLFSGIYPALPQNVRFALNVIQARHAVSISQQPSPMNNYTLIIDFDDGPPAGADWYEIEVVIDQSPSNPNFSVRMTENEVHGYEWTFGSQVRLEIDDPNTPQSPDYTRTQTVTFADWDPNQTFVRFKVWEDNFTLQPGMLVTMTDGNITKTHIITDLVVLGADAATDTVWGTGTPGTWVEVGHLCDNDGCAIRRTVIAADGTWLLDFSVPGGPEPDEQKTFDIQECYGHEARQHDEDGDSTQYGWLSYCPASFAIEQYTFNFDNPLLADLTIRRAIALGTDRQRILEQAFLPAEVYGQLVNSPLPPGNPHLAPAGMLTLYPYNPDGARTLLANAGWVDTNGDGIREKNGQELAFTFKTTLNPMRTIAAQIFRENMEAIGMRITVVQETPGVFFAENGTLARGDFDIAEFAWVAGLEDISILDLYKTGGEQNYGAYVNPVYDAAFEAFKNAATEEARITAAHQAQQIFTADLPAFYLFTRENIVPYQTPTGTSVTLTPLPQVTITYTNVNNEGVTAALAVSLNPADLPQNMQLVDSAYEIGTTAMFETVKVCLAYRDHWMTPAQEAALRLYHYDNGVWLDVTDPGYPDTVNNIVCGTATDFSLFAILLPTDSAPPVITPVVTGTPGLNDWYTSAVTVEWQVSDPESGIAASVGCEPVTLAADTAGETLVCTATNGIGLAQSESVTIKIDRTPPVITWLGDIASGSSFYYGFVPPEPTCAASDLLSGLEEPCEVSGYETTTGTHTLFARAADNAGNQAVKSRTYTVLAWTLKGFYQPVDMNGIYNVVKGGSTVPFKFEIFAGPTELTNTAYIKSFTYAETACNANALTDEIELTATGGTSLRYDETSGQFIYNWKTPKTAGKCYRVTIIAHDGSALLAYFKIR